ncbi:serine/threonine-protein phosphatase [Streptomyces sp. JH14]|uniref:SpoIIE family protein phosphatase n=1 Tax=Streptomyces sp. JH14 TaxID=2793630 RepID=UPI0023F65D9C|nr:SpoIIE family protein phosphatase [Streptomyces sp. JH14]MDF6043013.1 serine/threonine-protein phosphatase [Streptomyces sp. JH14]
MLEPQDYKLPLGLGDLDDASGHDADLWRFPPGAIVLLYTDGVTEARDSHGTFYDPVDRLHGRRFSGPGALLDALVADVRQHTGGHTDDDMALLAVMRLPANAPPPSTHPG